MAIYTVHAPPGGGTAPDATDKVRFVKEGFAFWALVAPFLWLIWNRLWLALLGWFAVIVAIQAVGRFAGESYAVVLSLAFGIWFALEAREIQRWTLSRRGWTLVGLVEGGEFDVAEQRFFEAWARRQPPQTPISPNLSPPASFPPRAAPSGIIGLFPSAGGGR
jgi:hypothetical protein